MNVFFLPTADSRRKTSTLPTQSLFIKHRQCRCSQKRRVPEALANNGLHHRPAVDPYDYFQNWNTGCRESRNGLIGSCDDSKRIRHTFIGKCQACRHKSLSIFRLRPLFAVFDDDNDTARAQCHGDAGMRSDRDVFAVAHGQPAQIDYIGFMSIKPGADKEEVSRMAEDLSSQPGKADD